jgi:hypothetical protein
MPSAPSSSRQQAATASVYLEEPDSEPAPLILVWYEPDPDAEADLDLDWVDLTLPSDLYSQAAEALQLHGWMLQVTVPEWASEGDTFHVTAHDGRVMSVKVPPGVGPGWTVQAWYNGDSVVQIEVPEEATVGRVIAVEMPRGQRINIECPMGVVAGDMLQMWYDAFAGILVPLL